ncbi:MAG: hypothetical protein J6W84_00065 [Bacteroidales bacterium]|nr:hypothetical protein [Bacteroidales bacterium]
MAEKKIGSLFLLISLLFITSELHAQTFTSNLKTKTLTIDSNVISLDSLSIIPNSFSLTGIDSGDYIIDPIKGEMKIINNDIIGKDINVKYRVFDKNFAQPRRNKPLSLINEPVRRHEAPPLYQIPQTSLLDLDAGSNLQSNGSVSRGIMVGNNQDFSLQSSLNLQLTGMLSDDIEIMANITDKNIPIQPEGNTRLVQDFNKIFINLNYKKKYSVTAGDIETAQPDDYFLKLNKRFLGMELNAGFDFKNNNKMKNSVGGGVGKGNYVTNKITAIEGVQGPYKLTGKNGETNLIILSGSERVYIDGQLLTRGQENDYTIDYNTGEITFTPKILITKEKRITVEFEYSDYAFTKYSLYTFNEFVHEKNSKIKINVNFYHEQDLKSQSIQPELDDAQKLFLAALGDRTEAALYPSADSVVFNTNEVLYNKIDTIVDGILYSPVYIRALNDSATCYRLKFSYTGAKGGNYILTTSTANGRVFAWVAPQDGIPQGDYEPVIQLVTPKLSQMATVALQYDFLKKSTMKIDFALSNHDLNTFSKHDNGDNVGMATKFQITHNQELKKKDTTNGNWDFFANLDYEFVHKNFTPIENFRDIEFKRNYNLTDVEADGHEQMLSAAAGFSHPEIGISKYTLNYYFLHKNLNTIRNELIINMKTKGWNVSTNTSYLLSNDSIQHTDFLKTDNLFSKSFKKFRFGITENLEYNIFKNQNDNNLRQNSYAFNEAGAFIGSGDSSVVTYSIAYKNRIDHDAMDGRLQMRSMANEVQSSLELTKIRNQRIRALFTFRNLRLRDSSDNAAFRSENNFVGSLDYTGRFCKNAIIFAAYYEAGSGLEPKRTFSFLKVAAGQGTHVWNDYNGNGIEELGEFEVAVFKDEANYIKIWLVGNDYVSTFNNQLTTSLQLRPAAVWNNSHGFRKVLSMFGNTTSFRTQQKNTSRDIATALNPFNSNLADSLLVTHSSNFKNDFDFNLPSAYFGFDFIIQKNQNKNLLYYGAESNTLDQQEVMLKSTPVSFFTIRNNLTHSVRKNYSEYLESRNYKIESEGIENSLIFTFKNNFSFTLIYHFQVKRNKTDIEKCIKNRFNFEAAYRMAKRGTVNVKLEYVNLNINTTNNGTLTYELLEALQPGHNGLWSAAYETNIGDYLRLNLLYEGRVGETGKVIHTGNVQVKAYF